MELTYATPVIVSINNVRQDLVIGVPGEVWGLNPSTGTLAGMWLQPLKAISPPAQPWPMASSTSWVAIRNSERSQFGVAIGDVGATHVAWSNQVGSYIVLPVYRDGRLYWTDDKGFANCIDASTGDSVYHERLPREQGARAGKPDFYASVALIADRLLRLVSRSSGTFVLPATPSFSVLAHNHIADDTADFNASPAINEGEVSSPLQPIPLLYREQINTTYPQRHGALPGKSKWMGRGERSTVGHAREYLRDTPDRALWARNTSRWHSSSPETPTPRPGLNTTTIHLNCPESAR